jgi:hypothetical protein
MPKYRTVAVITLIAVATLRLATAPVLADRSDGRTHASVAEPLSQIAKSPGGGSPPTRIGNNWGGFDHQPTSSEVQDREKAAGISISTAKHLLRQRLLSARYERARRGELVCSAGR